jgi:hypothetical protein
MDKAFGAACVACRHDMGEVAIGTPFGRLLVLTMPSAELHVQVRIDPFFRLRENIKHKRRAMHAINMCS